MLRFFVVVVLAVAGQNHGHMLGNAVGFSMSDANKFARLCRISYCDPGHAVSSWSCQSCVESGVKAVPGTVKVVTGDVHAKYNSQALVGRIQKDAWWKIHDGGCFIAFRGTDSVSNWITDFEAWRKPPKNEHYHHCEGCTVHSGFYGMWRSLEDPIVDALNKIDCKGYPLSITGHSLGGAVAALSAFTLRDHGYNVASVYTFESPRVGNDKFAAAFSLLFGHDVPTYRITHDHDPVVHVPPKRFGFIHVDTEVYFGGNGSSFKVCKSTEDPKCSNEHHNVVADLFYVSEHCGLPAFGDGFNICRPVCDASTSANLFV